MTGLLYQKIFCNNYNYYTVNTNNKSKDEIAWFPMLSPILLLVYMPFCSQALVWSNNYKSLSQETCTQKDNILKSLHPTGNIRRDRDRFHFLCTNQSWHESHNRNDLLFGLATKIHAEENDANA